MSRRMLVLVAVSFALAFVLAWQWLSPSGQRSTHWTPPAPIVPQLGAGSAGVQRGQETDAARLAAVLERPVFAVTRRPLPPTRAAAAAPVAPPSDPLDNVHVFGMFSGSEGGGLILRTGGKTQRLKVSESLGEWRLKEIRGSDAVFARAGQTRVLSLVQVKQGSGAAPGAASSRAPTPAAVPAPAAPRQSAPPAPTPAAPAASTPARPRSAPSSPFVIGGSR